MTPIIILCRSRRLHHKLEVKTLLLSVEPNAITVKSVSDLIPSLPQALCPLVMLMPLVIPLNLLVRLKNVPYYEKVITKRKSCRRLLWSFRAKMVVTHAYNVDAVYMFFNQEEDYIQMTFTINMYPYIMSIPKCGSVLIFRNPTRLCKH